VGSLRLNDIAYIQMLLEEIDDHLEELKVILEEDLEFMDYPEIKATLVVTKEEIEKVRRILETIRSLIEYCKPQGNSNKALVSS